MSAYKQPSYRPVMAGRAEPFKRLLYISVGYRFESDDASKTHNYCAL